MKEKSRFVLIVLVIILVSYLVFFLTALAYGLASSYTAAVDKWDADGIILNTNANDNIGRSLLYQSDYEKLLGPDVAPLGVGVATAELHAADDVALFGIEADGFLMPQLADGRPFEAGNEVVVSRELHDGTVAVGDTIRLQGSEVDYLVTGVVADATFQTSPVIYMSLDDWRSAVSAVSGMVGMRDETTVSALVTRGVYQDAYTNDRLSWQSFRDFAFALPGYQAQVLTFGLMISFLIGIAAFVLAIFIYILTMQKKSIFGVLKAEGISSGYIGRSVMAQVVILSASGLLVGMALAVATGMLLNGKVPFAVNPLFFGGISLLFLICAVLGGLASVRSVTKIDPVEAIK